MTHRFARRLIGYTFGPALVIAVPLCVVVVTSRSTAAVSQHVAGQVRHGWMAHDANPNHAWLYVTGAHSNEVGIYDLNKPTFPQIGDITEGLSGPQIQTVDSQGTLYVPNYYSGAVTIYPAASTVPSLTLSNGLYDPTGVAVDVNGDVYVANRGPSPSIQVYAQGQTTPYKTITGSLIQIPTQMVFDAERNLYIADNNTLAYMLPFGSNQVQSLSLLYMTSGSGIALDLRNGRLFISGVAGTKHSFWGYASSNPFPKYSFNGGAASDSLAVGKVGGREVIFAPDSGANTVSLYEERKSNPLVSIFLGIDYAVGVAYKPAGVP
jgi:NHL repeat